MDRKQNQKKKDCNFDDLKSLLENHILDPNACCYEMDQRNIKQTKRKKKSMELKGQKNRKWKSINICFLCQRVRGVVAPQWDKLSSFPPSAPEFNSRRR